MELYQLAYFVEVARQRNFTRAAERLKIAQPALSQQMKNLEAELCVPLFIRGRRETRLTPAGETLLPRAEALLEQAEAAKHSVAEVADLRAGRLGIASIPSVSASWLPGMIREFRVRHPGVELRLIEHSSAGVAEMVENQRVELGFLQLPIADDRLEHRTLLSERFVLVAPSKHALARRSFARVRDLATEGFIFYKGRARDTVLDACRQSGFAPRIACESGELETVRALVSAGLGIAVLPALATTRLARGLVSIPLRDPVVAREIGVAWLGRGTLSGAARAFLEVIADQSKSAVQTVRRPRSRTQPRRPKAVTA